MFSAGSRIKIKNTGFPFLMRYEAVQLTTPMFQEKTMEPLNNKPYIPVKHAIQAFFQNTGLIFTHKYAFFRWLAAFFSVKGQTSPFIYVVEIFRPEIAGEYKLAQANREYKRFSFFFNPR